jgi:hypothetical protein
MRVQDDDSLSGDLPRSVALQRETWDPMVDARLTSCTGTSAPWRSWMKSMTKPARPCIEYVARKMLAWYTKYLPKNNGAVAAVEASAPPPLARTPDRPAAATDGPVAWPSPIMRACIHLRTTAPQLLSRPTLLLREPPDRPAAAADEPCPKRHGGMALSDDEGQADK